MVDPRDLGLVSQVRSPHHEAPPIYLYEAMPGGVGLSSRLFDRHEELITGAAELISTCTCESGCPACTGPRLEPDIDATGDIATDFSAANYSGAPPQDLVPRSGKLVGTADAGTISIDDFNAVSRSPQLDVGAYRSNPAGNTGWPLQAGFKEFGDTIFKNGFDLDG